MALMLEALDVHDGNKILEIGTGTGTTQHCYATASAQNK